MTLAQIFSLARQMAATLRNGFCRAIHYLRSLGFTTELIRWALIGG